MSNHSITKSTANSTAYSGGILVIDRLMLTRLDRKLNPIQLEELWSECKTWLLSNGFKRTVREVQSSSDGGLDTMPREDVMSALAHVLTGGDWPINASPEKESATFRERLTQTVNQRGYVAA